MKRLYDTYLKRFFLRALAAGAAGVVTEFLTDQPALAGVLITAIYGALGVVGPQEPNIGVPKDVPNA